MRETEIVRTLIRLEFGQDIHLAYWNDKRVGGRRRKIFKFNRSKDVAKRLRALRRIIDTLKMYGFQGWEIYPGEERSLVYRHGSIGLYKTAIWE